MVLLSMPTAASSAGKIEQYVALCRRRERDKLLEFMENSNSYLVEITPFGIVAADGPKQYRFPCEGRLQVEDWPDLKTVCGPEDDSLTEMNRNEIVAAILENLVHTLGYSVGAASLAVEDLAKAQEKRGECLWNVIEQPSFAMILAGLGNRAKTITEALQKAQQNRKTQAEVKDEIVSTKVAAARKGENPKNVSEFVRRHSELKVKRGKLWWGRFAVLWDTPDARRRREAVRTKIEGRRRAAPQNDGARPAAKPPAAKSLDDKSNDLCQKLCALAENVFPAKVEELADMIGSKPRDTKFAMLSNPAKFRFLEEYKIWDRI